MDPRDAQLGWRHTACPTQRVPVPWFPMDVQGNMAPSHEQVGNEQRGMDELSTEALPEG